MAEPDQTIRRIQLRGDLPVDNVFAIVLISRRAIRPERRKYLLVLRAVPRGTVEPDLLRDDAPPELAALIGLGEQRIPGRDALRSEPVIDIVALQRPALVTDQA